MRGSVCAFSGTLLKAAVISKAGPVQM